MIVNSCQSPWLAKSSWGRNGNKTRDESRYASKLDKRESLLHEVIVGRILRAIHNHVGIGQIHAATMPLNFHAERSPSCDAPTRARAGKKDASRGGSYADIRQEKESTVHLHLENLSKTCNVHLCEDHFRIRIFSGNRAQKKTLRSNS